MSGDILLRIAHLGASEPDRAVGETTPLSSSDREE
jgi:hypothetical protein